MAFCSVKRTVGSLSVSSLFFFFYVTFLTVHLWHFLYIPGKDKALSVKQRWRGSRGEEQKVTKKICHDALSAACTSKLSGFLCFLQQEKTPQKNRAM